MSYFDWLCMIDIPDGDQRVEYAKLMCVLMDTEFRWVIRRDENRALDGLELRDIYEEETGEDCEIGESEPEVQAAAAALLDAIAATIYWRMADRKLRDLHVTGTPDDPLIDGEPVWVKSGEVR